MRHAGKRPVEGADALAALAGAAELRVAKGKRVQRIDLVERRPPDVELLALMLGRSGKLRAPALRAGAVFAVGCNQEMLDSLFGRP